MRRAAPWILIIGGTAVVGAYALGTSSRPSEPRTAALPAASRYDLTATPAWQAKLPSELTEISGIALSPDGRLFAHGDEEGTLWELDGPAGRIRKSFSIGATGTDATGAGEEGDGEKKGKKDKKGKTGRDSVQEARSGVVVADFEDLAIVGDRFFLVTSGGRLHEFKEGADGARVPHTVVPTGLEERCEVEGLAYDESANALLLLCKQELPKKTAPARVAIYAWSLDDSRLAPEPKLQVSHASLASRLESGRFSGSAMAFVPGTRALMLVAGPQKAFAEVTMDGRVITAGSLASAAHRQPEGLAFASDGTLLIADEGAGEQATLTAYRPKGANR